MKCRIAGMKCNPSSLFSVLLTGIMNPYGKRQHIFSESFPFIASKNSNGTQAAMRSVVVIQPN
jgi:hypothetical protein